ncbi:MAG: aspartate carbamoyltransferase catalytic subunit [Gemmatimonadota bacterium]|nr:aspartate carbamoyltransferase catalytic subunit [Gemmatimonadota bacterium]
MAFRRKDLLGLEGLEESELTDLLDRAVRYLEAASSPGGWGALDPVEGLSVANLFLEPSTRTRCSFELAEARLGIEKISIDGERLSLEKGETVTDTGHVLHAMGVNVIVIRHPEGGAPGVLAAELPDVHVVNAGDGANEHPTQGLLDLFTLRRFWGGDLAGKRVVMVGDVAHSRVVRSDYFGLTALGADVTLCGPKHLLPDPDDFPEAEITDDLDDALEDVDAVMALRIQRERFGMGESVPDPNAYRDRFGLTVERVERLPDEVPILHPGPMNRGVEMDGEVADSLRSLVLQQVTSGVAVRMSVLSALADVRRRMA